MVQAGACGQRLGGGTVLGKQQTAGPQCTTTYTSWRHAPLWAPTLESGHKQSKKKAQLRLPVIETRTFGDWKTGVLEGRRPSFSQKEQQIKVPASTWSGAGAQFSVLEDTSSGNRSSCKCSLESIDATEPLIPESAHLNLGRSQLVRGLLVGLSTAGVQLPGSQRAEAAGLISFPPAKLINEYFLVRAGESEVEAQGHIMTNPVAKTSMDSGLSKLGRQQVLSSIQQLQDLGACTSSCWIWPSITQRAYQTAELVAAAFTVGRSRIVPEYSFLDARGLGSYEGRSLAQIQEVYDSDLESSYYRPPRFVDGTPNESVQDVLVRVRQLMSILETQYQGEQVIVVSPDSDNVSVLQAALLGMDLRKHSTLAFRPGEVRKVVLNAEAPPPLTSGFFKCKQLPSRQWDCAVYSDLMSSVW